MSDSNSGNSGGSPYGDPRPGQNPYGQPAPGQPVSPYGEQPTQPSPYGGQPAPQQNPYGQPAQPPPYGQQPAQPPYGQQPAQPPYGQQPAQPAYGQQPHGHGPASDKRPGSVTAAAVITLIVSVLSLLVLLLVFVLIVASGDEIRAEIERQVRSQNPNVSTADLAGALDAIAVLSAVFAAWSLIACVLALLVLRRSNAARIMLVVSSAVTALVSLVPAFFVLLPGLNLIASITVIVLLFVGGANEWFKGKRGQAVPG